MSALSKFGVWHSHVTVLSTTLLQSYPLTNRRPVCRVTFGVNAGYVDLEVYSSAGYRGSQSSSFLTSLCASHTCTSSRERKWCGSLQDEVPLPAFTSHYCCFRCILLVLLYELRNHDSPCDYFIVRVAVDQFSTHTKL